MQANRPVRRATSVWCAAVLFVAPFANAQTMRGHPSIEQFPPTAGRQSLATAPADAPISAPEQLSGAAESSFVNWESPHVHPIDITPDGTLLLAVNTPDNRLELFRITDDGFLYHVGVIPVGLDPVTVRVRSNTEAWVVNHISDTVSIVDLSLMNVRQTLQTADEPADVIFAGLPRRAFISSSQTNTIEVVDPLNLFGPRGSVAIEGEEPRALATDGERVFVAIFESGNQTTALNQLLVSEPALNPYPNDENPPPNAGTLFDPPINPALPAPPPVSLIVARQDDDTWRDDNNADWSSAVFWNLHDHDLAIIDTATLAVTYRSGMMNLNMALAFDNESGLLAVIGTEANNLTRFEPNLNGTFARILATVLHPGGAVSVPPASLNPHLPSSGTPDRLASLGDPRGIDWQPGASRAYITGMGSNNVIVVDEQLNRLAPPIPVGAGPTGVRAHPTVPRVFVLNKFDGTISVLSTVTNIEVQRSSFYDPTPPVISTGRPHLYNTTKSSQTGNLSCGTCHIDGRIDNIAWDLGNPTGDMKVFNQSCTGESPLCVDWHPMKGPMTTQTLFGIIGTEPLHWRGDKEDLSAFDGAFTALLGNDTGLTPTEMAEFEAFLATLTAPPNPFRNLDGTLRTQVANGGDAVIGRQLFNGTPTSLNCIQCHSLPTGSDSTILPPLGAEGITQNMKTAQLRNLYEKTGFAFFEPNNNRGYGYIHDGSIATLIDFLSLPAIGTLDDQQKIDLEAFLLSFSVDTHAGVGAQATLTASDGGVDGEQLARAEALQTIAASGAAGLIARGFDGEFARSWYLLPSGDYQSDRAAEMTTFTDLLDLADPEWPLIFTLVTAGSETRIGVDRDEDGFFDRDELDACARPDDPEITPDNRGCIADIAGATHGPGGDGDVGFADLLLVLSSWDESASPTSIANIDCEEGVGFNDLLVVLAQWGPCE